MIRLQVATLADSANVREGLVSILSAGISVLRRPQFPSALGAVLVIVVEVSDEPPGTAHDLLVTIASRRTQEALTTVQGQFGSQPFAELNEDGNVATSTLPVVLNLGSLEVREPGPYEAVVTANGEIVGGARFDVVHDPTALASFFTSPQEAQTRPT